FDSSLKQSFVVHAAPNDGTTNSPISSVAYSPDGKYLACTSWEDNTAIKVLSATDGSDVKTYHELFTTLGTIQAIAWSPDGKHIAAASDKYVQVWQTT
ncbi:MAG TPA: hypothetical protein VEP90_08485, partial [Methylomirabilota bacterium]|nr:hypothetical protein [Methylomirabilota bacterium]